MKAELKFPFHSVHQFLEKWPIQREETLNRLIFRPGIDSGSNLRLLLGDVHAAACGLLMKGLRPFHPFLGFVDSLSVCPVAGEALLSAFFR